MAQLEDRRRQLERFRGSDRYVDPEQGDRRGEGAYAGMSTLGRQVGAGASGFLSSLAQMVFSGEKTQYSKENIGDIIADIDEELVQRPARESMGDYAANTVGGSPLELFGMETGGRAAGEEGLGALLGGAGALGVKANRARNLTRFGDEGGDVVRGVQRRLNDSYGAPVDEAGDMARMSDNMEYRGEVVDGVYGADNPTAADVMARKRMLERQADQGPAVGSYTDDVSQPPTRGFEPPDADPDIAAFESLDGNMQDMVMNKEIELGEALEIQNKAELQHMIMQEEAEAFAQRQARMDISQQSSPPAMTQQRGLGMDAAYQELLAQGFDEQTALMMLLDQ